MKPLTILACLVPAILGTAAAQADDRPGVVRITDNQREQQLISRPVLLVSFDDDNDTCLPPPPVCKVPPTNGCVAKPVAPTPPCCDTKGGCCDTNQCRKVYRCHEFDCRGRCSKCDDDDDECDCDACEDARKRWKKWQKWARKNGCGCDTGVCGNGACGSDCNTGMCGNGSCGNGVCGNGVCGNGMCGSSCGNGMCGCGDCQCGDCQCGGRGKKKWWDPMGLFCKNGNQCGNGGNSPCGFSIHGRGGYGLFGGDCGYDSYRADCERSWFQRWAHRDHCRRNAFALRAYRRDGFGWGTYHIAYPLNPQHFDARDGRTYAAQGYGIPMAVPTAPNVEHTYNYSWGVPASRLTPMSYPGYRTPQGPHDDHHNAVIYVNP